MRRRLFGTEKTERIKPVDRAPLRSRSKDAKLLSKEDGEHGFLANELLRLTTSMKQQFQVSGAVIREDNATLSAMQNVTESNRANLERDAKRLEHHASKSCFEWTMLIMVILIIWSFIATIIVMKIFPKRT